MQGGENTYFYFALESEKGNEYIGQFGFKDRGDVPSSYITRFIAFLMEQYGLSFDVKHSIMAYGGMMARGGKVNKRGRLAETLIDFKK
jgi:myo-inositol-hexaphosphate 3-phosphohydrolase